MNYYQSDLTKLSDDEIDQLIEEIEESGALNYEDTPWENREETWKYQAATRWHELYDEQERRNPVLKDQHSKCTSQMISAALDIMGPKMQELLNQKNKEFKSLFAK